MTNIVLVNQTSVLTSADVEKLVPVLQTQFDRDFEPIWRTGLAFKVDYGVEAVPTSWPIYLRDTTDQPGAGGYHLGGELGATAGYVFVKDALDAGESWTVDLTHEFLEMAGDPTDDALISLTPARMLGYHCLREVCDAVESDALGYTIDDVLVTDFVTPAYFFEKNGGGNTAFDHQGHLHARAPALLHGGYLGIQDPFGRWGQVSMFDEHGRLSRRAIRHGRHQRALARLASHRTEGEV